MQQITTGREEYPGMPLLPAELEETMGPEWSDKFYEVRKTAMLMERADPFRHGHEPAIWAKADQHRRELRELTPKGVIHEVNLGGNRASKSERAAKRIMQAMIANPGTKVWCCDSTEQQSRANQMALLWKYFPVEWRNEETGKLKRTKTTKINYSIAGGFSDNSFVLPNESSCVFKFYGMDVDDLEGPELDIVWADELVPFEWIDTLVYRLVTRNGLLHVTFTPKKGYTPTVGHYLEDARTVELAEAVLVPKLRKTDVLPPEEKLLSFTDEELSNIGLCPRVKFCRDRKARVIYFHTADNPYGNYEGMVEEVHGKPRTTVLMRAYGVVTKAAHNQFGFKRGMHVISPVQFAEILKLRPHGPRFHLVDPCSGRNWFMLWIYFPWPKKAIVYREWPSYATPDKPNQSLSAYIPGIGDPGPWTEPSRRQKVYDGEPGPAQDSFKLGLDRYKEEILRCEKGETIKLRLIDSRYSNAAKQEREGTTTLIEQMSDIGMEFLAMTAEKNILNADDGSIDMINSALYYDPDVSLGTFSPALQRLNEPNLLIVDTCPNTIFSLENWTGKDGGHGACKDPVDCLRGAFLSELDYVDETMLKPTVHSHFSR